MYTVIVDNKRVSVAISAVGPQGSPGVSSTVGSGVETLTKLSNVNLSGHRMVVINSSNKVDYASNNIPAHLMAVVGMTTGASILGAATAIQTRGEVVEPSWAWTLNMPIYLGVNGALTQVPPVTGFLLIVAYPITATSVFIKLHEPIVLSI